MMNANAIESPRHAALLASLRPPIIRAPPVIMTKKPAIAPTMTESVISQPLSATLTMPTTIIAG